MSIVVIVFLNPRNRDTLGNLKRVIALRLTLTDPILTDESQPPSVRYDDRIAGVEVVDNVNSLSGGDVSHQFCIGCGALISGEGCAVCSASDGVKSSHSMMVAPLKAIRMLRDLGYLVDGYDKSIDYEKVLHGNRRRESADFGRHHHG